VRRIHGGQNGWLLHDAPDAEHRDGDEPDEHDWTERVADACGAAVLHGEQREQDYNGHRHHMRLKHVGRLVEAFQRAQYRDGRRDDAVAIDQGRAEQPHDDERATTPVPARAGKGHQREDTAFAMIVGAHYEQAVLDRDGNDQQPENQREGAERRRWQAALGGLRDGPQRTERAGAEIAVDDPHGGEGGSRRGWLIDPRRRTMLLKRNLGHRHLRDVGKAAQYDNTPMPGSTPTEGAFRPVGENPDGMSL